MTKIRFNRMCDGRYVQPESGIELIRGTDDSDGYDRIEWQIWTTGRGKLLGVRPSLTEAKRRVREAIVTWTWDQAIEEYWQRTTLATGNLMVDNAG